MRPPPLPPPGVNNSFSEEEWTRPGKRNNWSRQSFVHIGSHWVSFVSFNYILGGGLIVLQLGGIDSILPISIFPDLGVGSRGRKNLATL